MKNKIGYIITFFIGVIGTIYVIKYIPQKNIETEKTIKEVNITETNTISTAINEIYDSVVVIETYKDNRLIGTGTGFVYKKNDTSGYIITNYHVIEGGNKYKVTYSDGVITDAKVLGSDEYSDIAVVSVDPQTVSTVAKLGESSKMNLGDTVFTVGSPLGKEYMGTVTKGILSGKDRTVTITGQSGSMMMEVLQTDAAINPGNSGGPLVNVNGEVIGVNSMKLVEDEIEGMGFAIPIEIVTGILERLENNEKIERPLIGIEMTEITSEYALKKLNIEIPEGIEFGVVVVNTSENYPAAKAGLQKGDIITYINDTKITSTAHFKYVLYKYMIGDTIKVKYNRNGKENETTMVLDKKVDTSN